MKTLYISKQLFMKKLILLIIGSPVIWGFSTLFLMAIVGPFLDDGLADHDRFYFLGLISFVVIIASMWINLIFRYRIDPTGRWHKIENVARIISSPYRLSYAEVKQINRVEGWEYKNNNDIRLNEEDLREAFLQAVNGYFNRGWDSALGALIASILFFVCTLILLYALTDLKFPGHWHLIGLDVLLFCACLYFYKSYKSIKKYVDSLKGEVQ